MFVDSATVFVRAGRGGDGRVSFRTEKYVEKGGPDGGDGGRGGNVVFVADQNTSTLVDFRIHRDLSAGNGQPGSMRRRHGKNGDDLRIKVPVGTQIYRDDELLADFTEAAQTAIVAKGGDGGFGNAHFKSSTRQAPRVAELGEKGDEFEAKLELKLIADVGLVGFPNAGKSTFLSVVSNARPEIADYAFTTLTPNLGVADIDDTSLLIADIPGLIEGASEGKGLGDAFLKHIERTGAILHLIDAYSDDPAKSYETIRHELESYSSKLSGLPEVVVISKADGLDDEMIAAQQQAVRAVAPSSTRVMAMSSSAKRGTAEVLRELARKVHELRRQQAAIDEEGGEESAVPRIALSDAQLDQKWHVTKEEGRYVVTGRKIEKFAARTDYSNPHSVNRLRDIIKKMGITHQLVRRGVENDDIVVFGKRGDYQMRFTEE